MADRYRRVRAYAGIPLATRTAGLDSPEYVTSATAVLNLNAITSQMVLETGSKISTWRDQSGGARDGTQATDAVRLVYATTGGPDNGPCVLFDPVALSFVGFADVFSSLTEAEAFIVRKVGADPTVAPSIGAFWKFGTSVSGDAIPFSDGNVYSGFGSTTRQSSGDPAASMANWHIYNVTTTATEWTDRVNGTQLFTTGTNTVAFDTACWLGRGLSAGSDGGMTAIWIFNGKLSTTDRARMYRYLDRVWLLGLGL